MNQPDDPDHLTWEQALYWNTNGEFHAVVACAMHVQPRMPSPYAGRARIETDGPDGWVICNGYPVCKYEELVRAIETTILSLRLSEPQAQEFRAVMREWVQGSYQ